jgi:hypothetical protein
VGLLAFFPAVGERASYPDAGWGMVKLTPLEQVLLVQAEPDVFQAVKGAWGRRGATSVRLRAAKKTSLRKALVAAWRNTAPKHLLEDATLRTCRESQCRWRRQAADKRRDANQNGHLNLSTRC